jgi:hypothetical protein
MKKNYEKTKMPLKILKWQVIPIKRPFYPKG